MTLSRATVDELAEVIATLGEWQHDDSPMQLHPGDLGWQQRWGAEALAAGLPVWRRDGQIVAMGLLESDELIRLTIAPEAMHGPSQVSDRTAVQRAAFVNSTFEDDLWRTMSEGVAYAA